MNQYHIYEAIGRGKHSTVYKGRKKKTIEYYAIKSVEKTQKSRVLQEVRTLHSLDHSNVLKFYAWYETSAHLWLVLEYCVGGDLLTLLRQDTRLPEESIHDFARDLVQALQFLHSKGVVYCDLKPSNVLLDENGRLKLCDFGLARRLGDISKSSVQQLPQAKRGTPCYMAPELFQEGGVHSFASDLWALGCVMYECYSGRPPFVSSSFTQLVNSILSDITPGLQGNPSKEFQDLVARLLTKDPGKRLQWSDLCQHPFWKVKLKTLTLPSQPAFANSVQLFRQIGNSGIDSAVHGNSTGAQKKIGNDQHATRLERNFKKVDSQQGQRKMSMMPSRETDACENIPAKKHFNPNKPPDNRNLVPLKEDLGQKNRAVNLLRLSKIVKTNLQKETEGGNYRQQGSNVPANDTDVVIDNNDLELDFAEQTEVDSNDEDEVAEVPSSPDIAPCNERVGHEKAFLKSGLGHAQPSKIQDLQSDESTKNNGIEHEFEKVADIEGTRVGSARMDVAATPPGVGLPRRAQRVPISSEQRKPTSNLTQCGPEAVKTSLVLSQALWHPSDLAVRPIMLYRRTEKPTEPSYEIRMMPFDPISCTDFVKLSSEQLDNFVNKVVASVSSNTALGEKLNTLKYLETLCTNVEGANILVNGPVMHMLAKMLRTSKPPAFRVQIICVMGLLIRHATLIEEELANSGIITVVSEGLRDKQEKVRRCSMATLGELLFYIATQNESSARSVNGSESSVKDSKASPCWQIPNTLIALVASILRKGEDDVTQHYALKTIENISSQGGEWAARFTNHEVLENLCYIFKASTKQENIRSTAGSCLVRLLRFSSSNAPLTLEKLTLKDLILGLSKGNPREQQVNVNLLNMSLVGNGPVNNIGKHLAYLVEEKTLVSTLMVMLEQSTEVLRGKAFLCAALLCKTNRRWLVSLCSSKLLASVERLIKEKDPYVRQCIDALIQTVVEIVPQILDSIGSDIQHLPAGKRLNTGTAHSTSQSGRNQVKSSLPLFSYVLYFFSSPVFRDKIINEQILKQLSGFLTRLQTLSFQGFDEFQCTLLRIFEVFGQHSSVPLGFPEVFISEVLPSLANLYKRNSSGDTRFLCLKIFFDLLVVYLDNISNSLSAERHEITSQSGLVRQDDLSHVAKCYFLPNYSNLVDDDDPIPMYAQKLLVMLLDIKCITVEDILSLKPMMQFFDVLNEDFSTVTVHSVRLCLFLSLAQEVDTTPLLERGIIGRVGALLEFVHAREMEDFLEPTLSLCRSLLVCSSVNGRDGTGNMQNYRKTDISEYTAVFLDLCCGYEIHIAEAAAECLFLLVSTVTNLRVCCKILSKVASLKNALERFCNYQASRAASKLQRLLLLVISAVCKAQRIAQTTSQPVLVSPELGRDVLVLEGLVSRLRSSNVQTVADAAADAGLELQVLLSHEVNN